MKSGSRAPPFDLAFLALVDFLAALALRGARGAAFLVLTVLVLAVLVFADFVLAVLDFVLVAFLADFMFSATLALESHTRDLPSAISSRSRPVATDSVASS